MTTFDRLEIYSNQGHACFLNTNENGEIFLEVEEPDLFLNARFYLGEENNPCGGIANLVAFKKHLQEEQARLKNEAAGYRLYQIYVLSEGKRFQRGQIRLRPGQDEEEHRKNLSKVCKKRVELKLLFPKEKENGKEKVG